MTTSSVQIRAEEQESALDIRIAALSECMDEHAIRLRKIFGKIELTQSGENVWKSRQEVFDEAGSIVLKVSTLSAVVCAACTELNSWAEKEGLKISIVAQANGLMAVALETSAQAAIALIEHFRSKLKGTGGSVVVLQIPSGLRGRFDVWGSDSNALPLMREIKRRFDPNRILNPGRFVGNI